MIGFTHYVSGENIGSELKEDPEELAACFLELSKITEGDFSDLLDYINDSTKEERVKIKNFVTRLSSAIED